MTSNQSPPAVTSDDDLGPVDFVVVAFPDGRVGPGGFERLLSLAEQGAIQILDVEFVARDANGSVAVIDSANLAPVTGFDPMVWRGAAAGLLDDADFSALAGMLAADEIAAVVVYENRWVLGVVDAWRQDGGRLLADGGLPADELVAALDATEVG